MRSLRFLNSEPTEGGEACRARPPIAVGSACSPPSTAADRFRRTRSRRTGRIRPGCATRTPVGHRSQPRAARGTASALGRHRPGQPVSVVPELGIGRSRDLRAGSCALQTDAALCRALPAGQLTASPGIRSEPPVRSAVNEMKVTNHRVSLRSGGSLADGDANDRLAAGQAPERYEHCGRDLHAPERAVPIRLDSRRRLGDRAMDRSGHWPAVVRAKRSSSAAAIRGVSGSIRSASGSLRPVAIRTRLPSFALIRKRAALRTAGTCQLAGADVRSDAGDG